MTDFGPLAMDRAELATFLAGNPPAPCYATVSSLRRDGSPFAVPLGYLYEDGWIYFSMSPSASGTHRIRRDPRVCVTVYNDRYPVKFATIAGSAEEYTDADQSLERRKFMRNMDHIRDQFDIDEYFELHEKDGRVVFRVSIDTSTVASLDVNKATDPETGTLGSVEGSIQEQ
jgi:nitroimidazol reductase NimA-like FMN-containing flavoprotein (pyridoxamine 5'-phosphate oxidase superfamily)